MARADDSPQVAPRLRAVRAQPALTRMGDAVVQAVALALVDSATVPADTLLPTPGPDVALQIVGARGQFGISVTGDGSPNNSLGAARSYEADADDGTWARVHVPGRPVLMGGALLPVGPAAANVDFEALVPATVFRATHASLQAAFGQLGYDERARRRFLAQIEAATTLAVSPDMRLLARTEQQQILERARVIGFGRPTTVQTEGAPAKACYWVARGPVTLEAPGEPPVSLALGDLFGIEALYRRGRVAACTVTAGVGARLVVLDRFEGTWRRLGRGFRADVAQLSLRTPWFDDFVRARGLVEAERTRVVDALAREPSFAGVPRATLHALLQGARALIWRVGLSAPSLIQRSGGWAVVLDGELMRTRNRPDSARRRPPIDVLEVVEPGDCAFVTDSDDARHIGYWRARRPAHLVYISRHRCDEVLAGGALSFANQLERRVTRRRTVLQPSGGSADVCLFEPLSPGPPGAMQRLAEAVGHALHARFGERTLVMEITAEPGAEARVPADAGAGVLHSVLPVEPGHGGSKIRSWLATMPRGVAQVLVVPGPGVRAAALRRVVDRVLLIDPTGQAPAILDGPGIPSVYASFRPRRGLARARAYPPNTVRFPHPIDAATPDPDRVAALARALSGRQVGVALGGGGAWGYMHLAVLFHMRRRGIPVDLISGASFGAVVGAYFAADPVGGLTRLLDEQKALMRSVHLGYVTGRALQTYLDRNLAGPDGQPRDLRDTLVPFFPACTDLVTGSLTSLHEGSLGGGVRASGSLPPFFAATYTGGGILLDGALSANVPAQVLENEGADLIVASEVIPAVQLEARRHRAGLGGLARDLNVWHRLKYAVAGLVTLAETSSEMSATVARVTFSETGTRRVLPTAFDNAHEVIEHAVSNPGFWNTMRRLERMWTDMAAPRVG